MDEALGEWRDAGGTAPPIRRLCQYLSELSPRATVAVEGTTHVVIYLNEAFARLAGRERADLIGRPFAEAVPEGPGNGCLGLLDRVFRTGVPEALDEQEHWQGGARPVFWSYTVWAILGDDGRPAGVMIQAADATETATFRRQAVAMNEALIVSATREHELAEVTLSLSERLQAAVRSRDRFLAVLSHELRNPLAALGAGLQLVRMGGGEPAAAGGPTAVLDMMERQLSQMVRLVEDLLDVSRISMGKLKLRKGRVDLATLVRDAVEEGRPPIDRQGQRLTVILPAGPVPLDADPTRLVQVFLNLLTNASKFSERGGPIRLTAERDGGEVVVRVLDAGIGIDAALLPRIFEPFVQADEDWRRLQGGMGIGLSLVKEFVELHGGRVEARSDGPGRGSEFVVRLPAADEATAGRPPEAAAGGPRGPRRRILVVDDNADAAEALAMLLRIKGHEVRTARDGRAGVAEAEASRPEVVLLDLGMTEMDGYEAARRIREGAGGEAPWLVALTGWGSDDERRRTHDAGFARHLVKPVDLADLLQMLDELPVASPQP